MKIHNFKVPVSFRFKEMYSYIDKVDSCLKSYVKRDSELIVFSLSPESKPNFSFSVWLHDKALEYGQYNNKVAVVAANGQWEKCMMLSNADKKIIVYDSLDNIISTLGPDVQILQYDECGNLVSELEPVVVDNCPDELTSDTMQKDFSPPNLPDKEPPILKKEIVTVAGKYRCNHCGSEEFFVKGDIFSQCTNESCLHLSPSWRVDCEIF